MPVLWDARQNAGVIEPFSVLHGGVPPKDLLVSFDGLSVHFPPEETGRGWFRKHWFHTDQASTKEGRHCVQGLLSLHDVREGDATLRVLAATPRTPPSSATPASSAARTGPRSRTPSSATTCRGTSPRASCATPATSCSGTRAPSTTASSPPAAAAAPPPAWRCTSATRRARPPNPPRSSASAGSLPSAAPPTTGRTSRTPRPRRRTCTAGPRRASATSPRPRSPRSASASPASDRLRHTHETDVALQDQQCSARHPATPPAPGLHLRGKKYQKQDRGRVGDGDGDGGSEDKGNSAHEAQAQAKRVRSGHTIISKTMWTPSPRRASPMWTPSQKSSPRGASPAEADGRSAPRALPRWRSPR